MRYLTGPGFRCAASRLRYYIWGSGEGRGASGEVCAFRPDALSSFSLWERVGVRAVMRGSGRVRFAILYSVIRDVRYLTGPGFRCAASRLRYFRSILHGVEKGIVVSLLAQRVGQDKALPLLAKRLQRYRLCRPTIE